VRTQQGTAGQRACWTRRIGRVCPAGKVKVDHEKLVRVVPVATSEVVAFTVVGPPSSPSWCRQEGHGGASARGARSCPRRLCRRLPPVRGYHRATRAHVTHHRLKSPSSNQTRLRFSRSTSHAPQLAGPMWRHPQCCLRRVAVPSTYYVLTVSCLGRIVGYDNTIPT